MPASRNTPTVPPTDYNVQVMGVGPDVVADIEDLRNTSDERPADTNSIFWDETLQLWIYRGLAVGDLPAHALGGAQHTPSTLADVNALISDANLDDAGDARPPIVHGPTHIDPLLDPVPYATAAQRGLMSNIAQTFAGVKTFNNRVNSPSHSILTRRIECEVFTSAGVNACLAELGADGGEVYIPQGTVVCTASIVIPVANITLRGAGKGTILDASAGHTFAVIDIGAHTDCVVENMQIRGQAAGAAFNLIQWTGDRNTVRGCYLYQSGQHGIACFGDDASIHDNHIYDCDNAGINFESAADCRVINNYFQGSYNGVALHSGSARRILIEGNVFYDTGSNSITEGWNSITVKGNMFTTPGGEAVYLTASGSVVEGNIIIQPDNGDDDIYLNGASGSIITGNMCMSAAGKSERAIRMVNSPNSIIQGNYSSGHDTCGIEIDAASTGCSIGGNQLLDATPMIDNGSGHLYEIFGRLVAGGVTDNFEVEDDGTVVFHGAGRVWDDIQFPINTGKVPAANFPTREALTPNTSAYAFSVNDYIDLTTNEYSHAYEEGGIAHMHAHVTIKTAQATGANRFVKLQVWVAYADTIAVAWAEVTLSAELTIPTGSGALKLFYLDLGNVDLSGYVIEAQINVRVKRIAATGGTEYADDVYITQVGAHLEKDTVGSRSENTK